MNVENLRKIFPALGLEIDGKRLVYFDNAATSQRPSCVVELQGKAALEANGNTHRAVHTLSDRATTAYEGARDKAREFIGAASRREVIFTSGATASLNLLAHSFCEAFLHSGDEIIVGEAEHHSNLVPWQMAAIRHSAVIKWLDADQDGYDVGKLEALISPRTRLVCVSHASNVLGIENPIRKIVEVCHAHNVPVAVDGAQGAVHCKVDVQEMDCDFYAFSAHKLYGPTGVGVLYGKEKWLEQMPPFMCGGEMVDSVSREGTTFATLPLKFEAGTPNFNAVAALVPALETALEIRGDVALQKQFKNTSEWLHNALKAIPGLKIYGDSPEHKLPIYSFTVEGVHHEDLALLLDKMGIAVRSGQMCAEPLMKRCGVTGMLRASLLEYNTQEEAEYFIKCLNRAIGMLK